MSRDPNILSREEVSDHSRALQKSRANPARRECHERWEAADSVGAGENKQHTRQSECARTVRAPCYVPWSRYDQM